MKFISSTATLLKHLQTISGVIPNKVVIPILEYFLFEIRDGELTITATDLEITMRTKLAIEAREEGSIAVPARLMIDTLKSLPEQPVTFTINDETKSIEIKSDRGQYQITGDNADDFPKYIKMESANTISFPASILSSSISATAFAIGNDDLRPAMSGLYFQVLKDELSFVSTDGNKLVLYKRLDVKSDKEESFLIPKKVLTLLKSALPVNETEVLMEYNTKNARFKFNDLELVCRLIDERFPDYKAAFPTESPNKLRVNKQELASALKILVIYANRTTSMVKFALNGSALNMTAEDFDYTNKATESISCDYEGTPMEIGFNGRYLLEMLNVIDTEEVELALSQHNRPGVLQPGEQFEGEEISMLVMPTLINY